MTNDRRTHERIPLAIDVTLKLPDQGPVTLRSRDFSGSGAFLTKLDISQPLPTVGVLADCTVTINTEHGEESETVKAKVVRTTVDGIGVCFIREVQQAYAA